MARTPHQDRQRDRRHDPDRERYIPERISPGPLLAVDRPEGQTSDRQRDDGAAEPVEVRGRLLIATLRDVPPGCPRGDDHEWRVDEKRGSPRNRVDEQAADDS